MEIVSINKEVVMPGFDGTGPFGRGSMTGGGRGNCVVRAGEGEVTRFDRGFRGRGLGMGRGRGNCFRAFRESDDTGSSKFVELQAKYGRLQADFEALKAKTQQG